MFEVNKQTSIHASIKTFLLLMMVMQLVVTGFGQDGRGVGVRPTQTTEKRLALVIGNGTYQNTTPLTNPPNDATDMAETLKTLGFEVLSGTNQSKREMEALIRAFGEKLAKQGGVGLFFYAGHGIQYRGGNYLIPVEANLPAEDEIEYAAINLNFLLNKMDAAQNNLNIVILDACRNNPFARSWRNFRDTGESSGLAKVTPPTGTIMLYSTQPGNVASDGTGRNGLFTEALLKQIKKPNVELDAMVKALARDVSDKSAKKQLPWKEGIVLGDFYFAGTGGGAQQAANSVSIQTPVIDNSRSAEDVMWDTIARINTRLAVEGYLSEYPNGKYAATARLMLKVFEAEEQKKPVLADEVGQYRLVEAAMDIEVKLDNGRLLVIFPGQPAYTLENVSGRRYKIRELEGYTLTFRSDSLYLEQPQGNFTLTKNQKSATVTVGPRMNVALASNGGFAKASSSQGGFPVESINDGDRKVLNWGNGGGWNDGTPETYPDWVEIEFKGSRKINEIRVFTLQDDYNNPIEPNEGTTFTSYGIIAFEVQFWNGSVWETIPGGRIEKNNKVYNKFTFPSLTTSKIRVVVQGALAGFSRIIEIEAWGNQQNPDTSQKPPSNQMITNSLGMKLMEIPAGTFQMGDKNNGPIHTVTISRGVYMGRTEVTQAQWTAVMGSLPTRCDWGSLSGEFLGDNKPVICVNWEDVQDFIRKLNAKGEGTYRLPTEAEWEYAARAGTTGDYAGNVDAMGWYSGNSESRTHEVATKQSNGWGLYDMHGNVFEWVEDWVGEYPSGAVNDPKGASSGSYRVMRGGGWYNEAALLRSAYRDSHLPSSRSGNLGFRVLRSAD